MYFSFTICFSINGTGGELYGPLALLACSKKHTKKFSKKIFQKNFNTNYTNIYNFFLEFNFSFMSIEFRQDVVKILKCRREDSGDFTSSLEDAFNVKRSRSMLERARLAAARIGKPKKWPKMGIGEISRNFSDAHFLLINFIIHHYFILIQFIAAEIVPKSSNQTGKTAFHLYRILDINRWTCG